MRKTILKILVVWALLLAARNAAADLVIGAELDGVQPVGDWNETADTGLGLGARVGYGLELEDIKFVIEAMLIWSKSPFDEDSPDANESDGYFFWSAGGGGRIGLATVVAPYLYCRVGYGEIEAEGTGWDGAGHGVVIDSGLALNLEFLPIVNFGVHLGYRHLQNSEVSGEMIPDRNGWVVFGLQVEVWLF